MITEQNRQSTEEAGVRYSGAFKGETKYTSMPDRGKILLIDNDEAVLKTLDSAFTTEGYSVYLCENNNCISGIIEILEPDIVISDIKFSENDTLVQLCMNRENVRTRVIFLCSESDINKTGLNNADIIIKPFHTGETIAKIEMLMRTSENYREKLIKDRLTDAYSRYFFNLRIAEDLERYRRYGTVFSIAFADMDNFDCLNNEYGSKTGDKLLKEFVSHVSGNIRLCDSIYRYSGEEFIIMLPDTNEENALIAIERLRHGFSNKMIKIEDKITRLSFSAGIKRVSDNHKNAEQLISDAGKAMYYAKKSGRNRIIAYDSESELKCENRTLMIIENGSVLLKLLKERFINLGYDVITTSGYAEAVAKFVQSHPDAIVANMEQSDPGESLMNKYVKGRKTGNCKVINLKNTPEEDKPEGEEIYCITGPFSLSELETRIMRALHNVD